jgi:hypothetical protein
MMTDASWLGSDRHLYVTEVIKEGTKQDQLERRRPARSGNSRRARNPLTKEASPSESPYRPIGQAHSLTITPSEAPHTPALSNR